MRLRCATRTDFCPVGCFKEIKRGLSIHTGFGLPNIVQMALGFGPN